MSDDIAPDTVPASVLLTPTHSAYLTANAIDIDVAIEAGVRSIHEPSDLPEEIQWAGRGQSEGILFVHQTVDGRRIPQYRPDDPKDPERKYLFPAGSGSIISVHPRMLDRVGRASKIVIVEGTKQYLACISAATSPAPQQLTEDVTSIAAPADDSTLTTAEKRAKVKATAETERIRAENENVLYVGVQGLLLFIRWRAHHGYRRRGA